MTDNTQELDEILENLTTAASDGQFIEDGSIGEAKVDILDWHNKQMLAELGDSLHNDNLDEAAYSDIEHRYDKYFDKLKEGSND